MLIEEPYCRECLAVGRRRQARIVDHIVPLEWSQCDERYNKQALCSACHDEKSKQERAEGRPSDEELAAALRKLKAEWLSSTS